MFSIFFSQPLRLASAFVGVALFLSPVTVFAQTPPGEVSTPSFEFDPAAATECRIGGIGVGVDIDTTNVLGSELNGTVELNNGSDYTLGGIRIAVGLFADEDALTPTYWSVVEGTHQLGPQDRTDIEFSLGTAALPAGEYTVGVAAFQGDEAAVFGALLREGAASDLTFTKTEEASSGSRVSVRVNDFAPDTDITLDYRDQIKMTVVTTNEGSTPLLDSALITSLTQGTIPLGAAVTRSGSDSVKLIPGGSRTTEVVEPFLRAGGYTAYAALYTPGEFQPVVSTAVEVTSEFPNAEDTSWPYISGVGAAAHPASATDLVACIDSVGEAEPQDGIVGPVAVDFRVTEGGRTVFQETVRAAGTSDKNALYVADVPLPVDALVTATLQTERFAGEVVTDEATTTRTERVINLSAVQTVEQSLRCTGEGCAVPNPPAPTAPAEPMTDSSQSFWFYAGIVLIAALLGYLMLRRLHPEPKPASDTDESVELQ